MSRSNVCFFFFSSSFERHLLHIRQGWMKYVWWEKNRVLFFLLFFFGIIYIYAQTSIYPSRFSFSYIYLLVCSWHRLILRPFIDCRRQREKKVFFLLLTPLNFWLLLVLKVTTTTTARTKRMREREKEMTKKIMEKTLDKKKNSLKSYTHIFSKY